MLFLNAQDRVGADVAVHLMLAGRLDRADVRVSAATSLLEAPGVSARQTLAAVPGLTLLTLDLGRPIGLHHGLARASALLHNVSGIASLIGLAGWCRRHRVDIIHVTDRPRQSLFGLLVARLAGCACLIHAHTIYYPHDASRVSNWRLHQADAVVGVSEFTTRSFQTNGRLPADRAFTVHNAVDTEVFRPAADDGGGGGRTRMRQRLGLAENALVIGCVARLMQAKGQETLIEAFASVAGKLPGARLVLAGISQDVAPDGQGDYRDYLVRRCQALGVEDAVLFPGFVPAPEMPDLYRALDLLAHPSIEEPFGLAVVEAMATELPVVAVNAGGIPEIIRADRDGLLVPPQQPTAMADAIQRLVGDPALATRLARSGRQRVVDAFSPGFQAASMLSVYRHIVDARQQVAAS